MMNELARKLQDTLADAMRLKTGERSEEQRKLSILITELEKVVAWSLYVLEP